MDAAAVRSLCLEHLTLFRVLLAACCAGYWVVLLRWLRPTPRVFRRGALAAGFQLALGLALDVLLVRAGAWTYRPMPFALGGVPLDLHVDWSLLWGFGLVWLFERWPGRGCSRRAVAGYLALWTAVTLAFDALIHEWMVFVESVSPAWWAWDTAFLATTFAATLWVYVSMGRRAGDRTVAGVPAIPPYARAWLYLGAALFCFYLWLPAAAEDAARGLGFAVPAARVPVLPEVLAAAGLAIGGWATHEFARRGAGTPIPWDPPRHLVDSGPYAFVSNPMQLSGVLLTLAAALWRLSWVRALYLVDVLCMAALVFRAFEGGGLRARFGIAADAYRARVRAWAPHARPRLAPQRRAVLFYDGECGLCRASVRALLALDVGGNLAVAPLGGDTSRGLLGDRPEACPDSPTVVLWEPGAEDAAPPCVSVRSRALLRALARTPFPTCTVAALEGVPGLPWLGDLVYRAVARRRRRFAPRAACGRVALPSARVLP